MLPANADQHVPITENVPKCDLTLTYGDSSDRCDIIARNMTQGQMRLTAS